ncbi:MAG TPA: M14 family metallopeptidase [Bdellovibrionota bacterium]
MKKFAALAFLFLVQTAHADVLAIGATNRKYPDVKAFVQKLAGDYRDSVTLLNLGVTDSKEDLIALKIGTGAIHNIVVSTHHGNEYGSTELALAFAESVARQPIQGQTIYIVPVLNITGYNSRSREERGGNGVSYDPNRNYPSPCGTEGPFTLKSTKLVADLIEREKIVASATLHTFSPAVMYPWGISTRDLDTGYTPEFKKIVADATVESRYPSGNSTELLYPADGTFEDYAFMKHGIWSILFELGYSHSPNDDAIKKMIEVNVPGLRRMFENAPKTNAANHSFHGKCDGMARSLDRHDE